MNFSEIKACVARQLRPYPTILGWTRHLTNMSGITSLSVDDYIFNLARRKGTNVFFLQVGANDGLLDDPIHYFVRSYGWRGILLEPVPGIFKRLKENYRTAKGLTFLNAALSQVDGRAAFYRLEATNRLPSWCGGLGSFRRDVLLSHQRDIPDIENYIVADSVECISFDSLVKRYQPQWIDLILIDTEGCDFEILRRIDLARFKPEMIVYEHKHLSEVDKNTAADMLTSYGYSVSSVRGGNTVAYR